MKDSLVLKIFLAAAFLSSLLSLAPVSYTHLDVYKRQNQGQGAAEAL